MNDRDRAPVGFYLLAVLIFFQAASGLFGGGALMLDPTGSLLQMPLELLAPSPFSDYFIPGGILFLVLGMGPSVVFVGLLRRNKWAWLGTLLVGAALIIWIVVEIIMIGYHSQPPLQIVYGTVGVLLLALALMPPIRYEMNVKNKP